MRNTMRDRPLHRRGNEQDPKIGRRPSDPAQYFDGLFSLNEFPTFGILFDMKQHQELLFDLKQHHELLQDSRQLVAASRDLLNTCRVTGRNFENAIPNTLQAIEKSRILIKRSDEVVNQLAPHDDDDAESELKRTEVSGA